MWQRGPGGRGRERQSDGTCHHHHLHTQGGAGQAGKGKVMARATTTTTIHKAGPDKQVKAARGPDKGQDVCVWRGGGHRPVSLWWWLSTLSV